MLMTLCEEHDCTNWCQWRITFPSKKSLFLCQVHKDTLKNTDNLKIIFMGAVPDGINSPEYRANLQRVS
jgi:hypothetical protein